MKSVGGERKGWNGILAVTISDDILALGHPSCNLQQSPILLHLLPDTRPSCYLGYIPWGWSGHSLSDWLPKRLHSRFSCPGPTLPPPHPRFPVKVTGERNFSPF
ncbi:hypothetical protein CEXT_596711 [Caerostris extrusa]|uniref:Uncharacterized protein n=1 Tax=Caerostris extrusa TaxID=172846 RepID=A0AAV4R7G1_CAEEX|nr:hypothetical protein CEXT_596711 [Caerostris extrusa]